MSKRFFPQLLYVSVWCFAAFCLACLLWACGGGEGGSGASRANKPPAQGRVSEMLVLMDSGQWAGPLGETMRATFSPPLAGMLRAEPMFSLRRINPFSFNDLLRKHRNIIIVATLNRQSPAAERIKQFFTKESLARIAQSDSLFMFTRPDEFAAGQMVLFLFGRNEEALARNIEKHKESLQNLFNNLEVARLQKSYLKYRVTKLEDQIAGQHQFHISLPQGYKFVTEQQAADGKSGFVWVRFPEYEVDRSVFVAYKPYESPRQFEPDSVIAWRNRICQQHIFGDPEKPNSFVVTEVLEPAQVKKARFNNLFAMETRGLWKTYNISMGGPFLSYVFVEPSTNRLYYAEGFVFAPARNSKREFIREFEALLKTIKPVPAS